MSTTSLIKYFNLKYSLNPEASFIPFTEQKHFGCNNTVLLIQRYKILGINSNTGVFFIF